MIEIKDCFVNEFTEIISRYILQFFDTRGKLRVGIVIDFGEERSSNNANRATSMLTG